MLGITGPKDRRQPARHPSISRGSAGSRRCHIGGSTLQIAQYRILRPPTREIRSPDRVWSYLERAPPGRLSIYSHAIDGDIGFRDVDPLTGTFMDSRAGGRSKKDVERAPPNALDGGNYFANLYSIMLERDVGSIEFSSWLCFRARNVYRPLLGSGAEVVGAKDQTTSLRPRALHVGVCEGHVCRLVLDGPWKDRLTGAREGAAFRRIAEAAEEGGGEEESDGDTRTFGRCADMTEAILSSSQTEADQQTARKRRRGTDDKADSKKTWYAPPGTALDELMLHLHLGVVACTGRLTSYSHWDSLSLPAHGIIIRTWCGASMGGLDPDVL
ncbi:unnamed protein product [Ectocarpus sp. CCAP 1310/34]|nr:unnamed protein product [Ectocarpus sp. CCAP 1310/34]